MVINKLLRKSASGKLVGKKCTHPKNIFMMKQVFDEIKFNRALNPRVSFTYLDFGFRVLDVFTSSNKGIKI